MPTLEQLTTGTVLKPEKDKANIPAVKRPRGRPRKVQIPAGELVEQPKLMEVNKPEPSAAVGLPAPSGPIPPGWRMVFNRLSEQYQIDFDSQPQKFGPNEFKLVSADIAPHICNWSIIQLSTQGPPVRALVLDGKKGYGVPLKAKAPVELIDRAGDSRTKTDGVTVTPKLIYV